MYALTNCIIYTGYERLDNHAVIIEKEQIKKFVYLQNYLETLKFMIYKMRF